jgi:AI-2 transport protein TqsA
MTITEQEQRLQTVCLLILTSLAVALAFYWLRSAMVPFTLALFFSYALAPAIDLQVKYLRIHSSLAVTATLVLGFFILTTLASLVTASVSELTANAAAYQRQIEQIPAYVDTLLRSYGIEPPEVFRPSSFIHPETVGSMLMSTTNAVVGIVSQGTLVMIFLIFLLAGRTVGTEPNSGVWGEIEFRIKRYVVTKIVTSGATGVLVWLTLRAFGVDLALLFGLFAFLLNFIPNIGSVIATLLPLPVILFDPDLTATTGTLALFIPAGFQFIIGNFVEPRMMGTSLDLHPVAILLALVVWGALWGVVGMLLATPITAVMKILFERLELTKPMGALMAGRFESYPRPVPQPPREPAEISPEAEKQRDAV